MAKVPMKAKTWNPPTAPARARQSVSDTPVTLTVIPLPGRGPEDVVVDATGSGIVGLGDGRILRVSSDGADGAAIEQIADTQGRPLGIELAPSGELLVCDARLGVLNVAPGTANVAGRVSSVVNQFAGRPLHFCNNASIAEDGSIYFTDSSQQFGIDNWRGEVLAHTGTGRLYRRSTDGALDLLIDGLEFANGVALAPDASFVAVAETSAYRIRKLWLTGPREGLLDTLVDNLPGFPDNISLGSDGLIWVALPSARDRALDVMLPRSPLLRKAVWALPESLQPKPQRTVWVQAYDLNGNLVHDLQTSHPDLYMVTGVREVDGTVWLSSLVASAIGVITL
ncbi:sugar lactone lactonase YvrE [Jatrophihabitans sp. GAS493]|uniref:SMP-30/gluconolactonase/LRE family protein n=1 Tax=Jatrophihabitans sp. GAS493 TaxID=1907575 RepID=UPI000BBFCE23|nr:SMP-30/gluconolactonase/LRE family protein [Jatrophihabitans sp. GAS493]SOD73364.1 sugar lactone lactonase YvrE [Jatrophihabitans sp. GAS493]